MKSATVFLVALTVSFSLFLESSTAAVDSAANKGSVVVNDSVKKSLDELLNVNAGLITSAKRDADNAILTEEGANKEVLASVSDWLAKKLEVIIQLQAEMNKALNNDDLEYLESVSAEITEAIAQKKSEWATLINTVLNDALKQRLNEKVSTNFANADVVDVALKGVVCQSKASE